MKRRDYVVKKILLYVAGVVMMVIGSTNPVMASGATDVGDARVQERSLLDDVEAVSDIQYMRARNGHLMYGSVELTKVSPTRARLVAITQAYHVCPKLYVDIYIDRYDTETGQWNQWRNWEYSTSNSDHLTKNMEIIVQSGYYYSVRGYHTCKHDNVIETATTVTNGLYIGTTDKPII